MINKYLKYKNKYLNKKIIQNGGTNIIIIKGVNSDIILSLDYNINFNNLESTISRESQEHIFKNTLIQQINQQLVMSYRESTIHYQIFNENNLMYDNIKKTIHDDNFFHIIEQYADKEEIILKIILLNDLNILYNFLGEYNYNKFINNNYKFIYTEDYNDDPFDPDQSARNNVKLLLDYIKENEEKIDENLMEILISYNYFFILPKFNNNKQFVLQIVRMDGMQLEHANDELKNNIDTVIAAIDQNIEAFEFASKDIKSDKRIVLKLVKINGLVLQYADPLLQNDKEIVLAAVNNEITSLDYASDILKSNKEFMLDIININGQAIKYASEELSDDKSIVLKAVTKNGEMLRYASILKQYDPEIVLAAIAQNGTALQFAHKKFQIDKDMVMKAVKNNGYALRFASKELQNDKEIVIEAVKNYGNALEFANEQLKNDHDIIIAAVTQNEHAENYIGRNSRYDSELYGKLNKLKNK